MILRDRDPKLLTCVLPKGAGLPLLRRLREDLGIVSSSVHSARGSLGSDPSGLSGRVEKDVVTVVVPEARADELFAWIYVAAEVGREPGRFLHLGPLAGATSFHLPEGVPAERG